MMDESVAARDARSHAQISWYSTSTTSILPCTEVKPFLESFEVCENNLNMNILIVTFYWLFWNQINRSVSGLYREAVQLAMEEATQATKVSTTHPALAGVSPSPGQSPREIMV